MVALVTRITSSPILNVGGNFVAGASRVPVDVSSSTCFANIVGGVVTFPVFQPILYSFLPSHLPIYLLRPLRMVYT